MLNGIGVLASHCAVPIAPFGHLKVTFGEDGGIGDGTEEDLRTARMVRPSKDLPRMPLNCGTNARRHGMYQGACYGQPFS